jgi:hypothetical protein
MAAQPIGGSRWPKVKEVLGLFVAMGCETLWLPGNLIEPNGDETPIRFLYNPASKVFVVLDDYDDEMRLTPSEIDYFERRLDIEIPKKDSWKLT